MNYAVLLQSALVALLRNKMRSVLTVLGIVIAVASTITVVSVVRGFTEYVADFLQGLGTNAMWVWPERPGGDKGNWTKPLRGRARKHPLPLRAFATPSSDPSLNGSLFTSAVLPASVPMPRSR